MESLTERMRSDLRLRGRSPHTIRCYLGCVHRLGCYYGRCPSKLSHEDIRAYLLYLINVRKLSSDSLTVYVAALTFFYVKTLRRPSLHLVLAWPKRSYRLPTVLSEDEVGRLLAAARTARTRAVVM